MNQLTQILFAVENGEPHAADQLLPLIYDELRRLAAHQLQFERPGQLLQTTALVHETYMRLFGNERPQHWNSRGHFFSAASRAMRRILIDQARRRLTAKRGGDASQEELHQLQVTSNMPLEEILALNEALDQLAEIDKEAAELVQLRFFGGFTMLQVAETLNISERSAYDLWSYARAWLKQRLRED